MLQSQGVFESGKQDVVSTHTHIHTLSTSSLLLSFFLSPLPPPPRSIPVSTLPFLDVYISYLRGSICKMRLDLA